jgi:hypothetical protein
VRNSGDGREVWSACSHVQRCSCIHMCTFVYTHTRGCKHEEEEIKIEKSVHMCDGWQLFNPPN